MARTRRECPGCGADGVVSVREAELVFRKQTDTRQVLSRYPDATHICTKCYSVKS